MSGGTRDAWDLLTKGMDWLSEHYVATRFYTERDLVWTLQRWLVDQCESRTLPFAVFNDYAAEPGRYRALSADIAVVTSEGPPIVMEFKYEPSHRRRDIGPGKFPVVDWTGVVNDAERVQRWVAGGRAAAGMAVLIDEGAAFAGRAAAGHQWRIAAVAGASWSHWGSYGREDLDVHVHRLDIHRGGL